MCPWSLSPRMCPMLHSNRQTMGAPRITFKFRSDKRAHRNQSQTEASGQGLVDMDESILDLEPGETQISQQESTRYTSVSVQTRIACPFSQDYVGAARPQVQTSQPWPHVHSRTYFAFTGCHSLKGCHHQTYSRCLSVSHSPDDRLLKLCIRKSWSYSRFLNKTHP